MRLRLSGALAAALLVLAVLAVGACGSSLPASVTSAPPPHATAAAAPIRAASRRVDLTPTPGVATFGHGPDANVSEGTWTRVECRVVALEQGPLRVAIVPCDLAASSTLLQREVAERVKRAGTDLPTTRIFMTATHTHAGPAHYLDEEAFGGAESTRAPGFDPDLVELFATRIAQQIVDAFAHLVDAEARSVHFDENDHFGDASPCADCGMWGITWNRSLEAHATRALDPPAPAGLVGVDAAIDPSLHWLELRARGTHVPIAGLAFYAMHPSVLPSTNRRLGADVSGLVSRLLEARLRSGAPPTPALDPVVGVINTNEGDMSPVWRDGTKEEATVIARTISGRIERLRESAPAPWKDRIVLDARYREIDLPDMSVGDGTRTCRRSELGESAPFGACDHPTSSPDSPTPWPTNQQLCQGPKLTPFGEAEWALAGRDLSFPSHVPIGLLRFDDSAIPFVPAEVTVSAGRAMRDAVLRQSDARYAFLGGLSNGYILYVTTAEEYRWLGKNGGCLLGADGRVRQSYEGASNLYGPNTARYLQEQLEGLAQAMRGADVPGVDLATAQRYATGPVRHRLQLPSGAHEPFSRRPITTCTLRPECPSTTTTVCFRWSDAPVGDVALTPAPWISLVDDSGVPVSGTLGPVNDLGFDFATRVGAADDRHSEWSALFAAADEDRIDPSRRLAIRVGAATAPPVQSATFTLHDLPPECTPQEAAECGPYDDAVLQHPYRRGWNGKLP